ncbi:DUF1203 domain-containing protein [Streptomyces sp. T028]|uniref:DUF1203 domain-containing protein n=1 Tax=Streptomyces sp. T028 TaxID=3394379 RepID=UPI003A8A7752
MTETETPSTTVVTYSPRPIPADVLDELRAVDDAGRQTVGFADREGGAPLRCCLRRSRKGESIALVSYAPLRRWAARGGAEPGAYDEQGPVFIHGRGCPGATGDGLPFTETHRTVRRYSADGHILGGELVTDGDFVRAFRDAFDDPDVALVHVRAVEYGCFLYEVQRARRG